MIDKTSDESGEFPKPKGKYPRGRQSGERPRRRLRGKLPGWAQSPTGNKAHSLVDKIYSRANLEIALKHILGGGRAAGPDGIDLTSYARAGGCYTRSLKTAMRKDIYTHGPLRQVWIPKPGSRKLRMLAVPNVYDRHAQQAIRQRIEPLFEPWFEESSFGYRPNRSAAQAVRRVRQAILAGNTGVVDGDIASFYDSVDKDMVLALLEAFVADGRVLRWLEQVLHLELLVDGHRRPLPGIPQGGVLSPLLANLVLTPVDQQARLNGWLYTRFADDWVTIANPGECTDIKDRMTTLLDELGLTLNNDKTGVFDIRERPLRFLGKEIGFRLSGHLTVTPAPGAMEAHLLEVRERFTPGTKGNGSQRARKALDLARGFLAYHRDCDDTGWIHEYDRAFRRLADEAGVGFEADCVIREYKGFIARAA